MELYNFVIILALIYHIKSYYTFILIFTSLMLNHLYIKYKVGDYINKPVIYIKVKKLYRDNSITTNNIFVKYIILNYNKINYYYKCIIREIIEMMINLFIFNINKYIDEDNNNDKLLNQITGNINLVKKDNIRKTLNNLDDEKLFKLRNTMIILKNTLLQ